jgi:hypothetical protein
VGRRGFRDDRSQVKGMDPKYTWEIVVIYRAPCENMGVIEGLVVRSGYLRNSTERRIIGSYLNLPQANWNGDAGRTSGTQAFLNNLVWDNSYTQAVGSPSRGDALLDVSLVQPENSLISCCIVQGISDNCGVLLEVEWEESCRHHKWTG